MEIAERKCYTKNTAKEREGHMNKRQQRRQWKKTAKEHLKKKYWILVVVCLFASFLGIEFGMSFAAVRTQMPQTSTSEVYQELLENEQEEAQTQVNQKTEEIKEHDTNAYLGRSRGVLSSVVNSYSSGSFLLQIADGLQNMVGSGSVYLVLMILGGLAVYCIVWFFIKETYLVISRRIVLESRTYEKVPIRRFLYPIQTKKWTNIAGVMMVKSIYYYLWSLTGIGGIIKKYSYSMVPYLLAENPGLRAKEAITLSRKMMKGHKWEYFVAEVSFLGWEILNMITLGISGIFYSNPYRAAFFGEFYAAVRSQAKENQVEGTQLLEDQYLYQRPEKEAIEKTYSDLKIFVQEHEGETIVAPKGIQGILSRYFGIMLFASEQVQTYEKQRENQYRCKQSQEILNGQVYPGRMAPKPLSEKEIRTARLMPTRSYSAVHLIMMFFVISFIGWLWEVSLHLISDGVFVNRGVLHGPWLPIYGSGGILILVILRKLREKPILEFLSAVVLCGCVEYYTAWHLELVHNGQKWWDYSGYFLNLHGRICAEGLLVFGLGGLAIVYLVAPVLDDLLNKINRKVLLVVTIVLLFIYMGDKVYSDQHPNTGEGITSVCVEKESMPGNL